MSKEWNTSGNFEHAPAGLHDAKLIEIVDLGTQKNEYKGEEKPPRRQNLLTWELVNETRDDGKRHTISKFYTTSLGEKANLTKDLTSWLGKAPSAPFDPKELLGKGCQITIVENEETGKARVSTVVGLGKNTKLPDGTENDLLFFSLDEFDEDAYSRIRSGIQAIIEKSPEYQGIINGVSEVEDTQADEDIPF